MAQFPPEDPRYLANRSRSDPRLHGRGYSPAMAPQQATAQRVRDDMAERGTVPMDDVIRRLDAKNLPPQLVQGSFLAVITGFGAQNAVRLIPKNPKRWSFLVANFLGSNLLMFSFDHPMDVGAQIGAGVPIGGYYQEANGEVSINDIFVFCNDPVELYPITVLGYEGGISIAGNKR